MKSYSSNTTVLGLGSELFRFKVFYESCADIVSFPDPAFKLDKGLAHFAQNLGLPDLAGKE